MKEVVAITLGVYKDSRRRPGTTFWVGDDETADWYVPVAQREAPAAPQSEEMTYLEAGKGRTVSLQEVLHKRGRKPKEVD